MMMKFLYSMLRFWTGTDLYLKSYHAKVAFLTHCLTCTKELQNSNDCINEILKTLISSYDIGVLQLPQFHENKCLKILQCFTEELKGKHRMHAACFENNQVNFGNQ